MYPSISISTESNRFLRCACWLIELVEALIIRSKDEALLCSLSAVELVIGDNRRCRRKRSKLLFMDEECNEDCEEDEDLKHDMHIRKKSECNWALNKELSYEKLSRKDQLQLRAKEGFML
ncbi:hypothetical protein ACOME3_000243 [Neoechinorhynchus agilis]